MANKTQILLLLIGVTLTVGCSNQTLREDHGKSVAKNTILQTENLSAPQDSHPALMMDGQKAADVVENYRNEGPKADTAELTK